MGLLTALSGVGVLPGGGPGTLAATVLFAASLLDRFRNGHGDDAGDADGESLLDDDAFGDRGGGDDLDGLGGMDDWDDDPFGGDDDAAELSNRVEELENEVASLSSTVNTVRSENEEISERVEEIGENVRSLLDVYEMVTRGVNPFVDDAATGDAGGDLGGDTSFGLFDGDDEERGEDLDDDLADADAESFFDEDLVDGDDDADLNAAVDGSEADDDTTDTEPMATENGGTSFSELKDEYESDDADWADGDEPADDGGFEFVEEGELSAEPRKPYLTSLPGDYVGDLMVMEWLEYLVEESDATDAVRAVNYYERIEWVDEDVADRLKAFLSGFGDVDRNRVDEPGTAHLTLDHHTQSLKYVMQLTNATAESVVIDRWPQLSGGFRGSQR